MNCSMSGLGLVAIVRGYQCRHNPLGGRRRLHWLQRFCPVPLARASRGLLGAWQIVS
jgi:hypothetical protein